MTLNQTLCFFILTLSITTVSAVASRPLKDNDVKRPSSAPVRITIPEKSEESSRSEEDQGILPSNFLENPVISTVQLQEILSQGVSTRKLIQDEARCHRCLMIGNLWYRYWSNELFEKSQIKLTDKIKFFDKEKFEVSGLIIISFLVEREKKNIFLFWITHYPKAYNSLEDGNKKRLIRDKANYIEELIKKTNLKSNINIKQTETEDVHEVRLRNKNSRSPRQAENPLSTTPPSSTYSGTPSRSSALKFAQFEADPTTDLPKRVKISGSTTRSSSGDDILRLTMVFPKGALNYLAEVECYFNFAQPEPPVENIKVRSKKKGCKSQEYIRSEEDRETSSDRDKNRKKKSNSSPRGTTSQKQSKGTLSPTPKKAFNVYS